MKRIDFPEKSEYAEISRRPVFDLTDLEPMVSSIIDRVRTGGDRALKEYTFQFDGAKLEQILVSSAERKKAVVSEALKDAINLARKNIEVFHRSQQPVYSRVTTSPGVICWQKSLPLKRIGLYVPGGTAPLFSTVLMLAIPARIAGCEEIVLCTPPNKQGLISSAILYTANLLGIDKIYKVGGAQAIAAMALGTETIPMVNKIFGPGNQFVTVAKQLVCKSGVAIDLPAGPTELAVIADETANPVFVASDLLSQAEHGVDSQVLCISTDPKIAIAIETEVHLQLAKLKRHAIAKQSMANSAMVLTHSLNEAIDLSNEYAPEHLILAVRDPEALAEKVTCAGSVFLGPYSAESAGDYATGPNHTLPTNAAARAYSGVSLDTYLKKINFQEVTAAGLRNIGPSIEEMALAEGLQGHRIAVQLRLQSLEGTKDVSS